MKVEKVLSRKQNGGGNAVTQSGLLKLTPISSCEFVANLEETNVRLKNELKIYILPFRDFFQNVYTDLFAL